MQQEKKFIDKYHIVLACKYEMVFFQLSCILWSWFEKPLFEEEKNMNNFHKGGGGVNPFSYYAHKKTEKNQYKRGKN